MHGFVEKRHVLLVLDDLDWVKPGGLIESTGNPRQVAASLGIFVSASQTVHSFGFSLRGVFVSSWRRGASPATCDGSSASASSAACTTSGEIRPVEGADEQALKAPGTLQPEALKIRTPTRKTRE